MRLIGASKAQTVAAIRAMVELGVKDIGESYVQEALEKQAQLQDLDITWHFIGHIQGNKTRDIATHFDWVHSVDRLKIARRLSLHRPDNAPDLNLCLQINLQREPSKSGLDDTEIDPVAATVAELPGIRLRGVMAIPEPTTDFDQQRAVFRRIRGVFERLVSNGLDLDTLSMGMSDDSEAAIAEGATMVRIGTALFGPRPIKR